jgi:phosphomannomutase
MGELFGTDGVRGIANQHPMTIDLAMKIGCSAAHIFKSTHSRPKIVIGKDTRLSGYMVENAIASGICSMGVDVLLVGPLPTPGIAFITNSMRADAGIVISRLIAGESGVKEPLFDLYRRTGADFGDKVHERLTLPELLAAVQTIG